MPTNSSVIGLLFCGIWLLFFYGANLTDSWFGFFSFDSSELPIVTIYAMYIPIFIMMIKKETDLGVIKRFVMPILSICGCMFMIVAACFAHRMAVVAYLIVFSIVMIIGSVFAKKTSDKKVANKL
jgi:APA family basic amino acid/polyamine antiporter